MIVAVVTYEGRDRIAACLESLAGADVHVVDNGGTAAFVRERFPGVTVHEPGENLGFGRAVNLVAARTESEWLASANDDVVLEPGALDALLAAAGPDTGALAPRLVLPDGTTQRSVHPFPSPAVHLRPHPFDPDRAGDVPWAMAAFAVYRRAAFDAAGGFDERQWMYAEDLDLGWRLHRAGWRTRYVPGARVRHESAAATAPVFGPDRTPREMEATYGHLARRRGTAFTWATAATAYATHLRPGDRARYWRRIHRLGLRGPATMKAAR